MLSNMSSILSLVVNKYLIQLNYNIIFYKVKLSPNTFSSIILSFFLLYLPRLKTSLRFLLLIIIANYGFLDLINLFAFFTSLNNNLLSKKFLLKSPHDM